MLHKYQLIAVALLLVSCGRSTVEKGTIALRLGDYPSAISFFERALDRDPADFDARLGLGKALLQKGADRADDSLSWRDACRHLYAAQTLRPSARLGRLLSQAWSESARINLGRRDTVGALEALSRAMEADTRNVEPFNRAGIIYFRLHEHAKARALFRRAAVIDSQNTSVLFNLGMVAWADGDRAGAHDYWLRALKRAPGDEAVLHWFARAEKHRREHASAGRP